MRVPLSSCTGLEQPRCLEVVRAVYQSLLAKHGQSSADLLSPEEKVLIEVLFAHGRLAALTQLHAAFEPTSNPRHRHSIISKLDSLPLNKFREEFLEKNRPVVLRTLTTDWTIRKKVSEGGWTCDRTKEIDLTSLKQRFGGCSVPVERTDGSLEYTTFARFVDNWEVGCEGEKWYLKDWHIYLHDAALEEQAATPLIFADDWMNAYFALQKMDYKFAYLGRKGTNTKLHCDIINSYSWSTNVCGKKKWMLLPPEQSIWLFDVFGQKTANWFACQEEQGKAWRFPSLQRCSPIEVMQSEGETIFVPSGWYHTVENVQDTLSINANWCNGYNLEWTFRAMQDLVHRRESTNERSTDLSPEDSTMEFAVEDFIGILRLKLETIQSGHVNSITENDLCQIERIAKQLFTIIRTDKEQMQATKVVSLVSDIRSGMTGTVEGKYRDI